MYLRPLRLGVLVFLLLAGSLAVRLAALCYWGTGAIESEGAEYARLAENLRHGVGFVGIVTPGPQLNFNPLFPVLIAAASFITKNFEWAGRLVALLMGSLLPLPVFGIASRLFNPRVGLVASVLTMLHPLLLNLSFTVFSEGPYTTLLLAAVYFVLRALDESSVKRWLFVGAAFGLSYLVRTEATALFVLTMLFVLVCTGGPFSVRGKRVAVATLIFVVLALPQVIFIYRCTGKLKLEVKSTIFFYTGMRIFAAETHPGEDYVSPGGYHEVPSPEPNMEPGQKWPEKWAFYGIDSNLKGMGFPLRQHVEVIRDTHTSLKDLFHLLARGVRQNGPLLLQRLSADWLGAPLLPALALLGALRRPWRGSQARSRLFVLVVGAAPVIATFFALWSEDRYYFVLVPLLSIWAANGLVEVGLWLHASILGTQLNVPVWRALSQWGLPVLMGLAMIISPVKAVRRIYVFREGAPSTRADKEIGLWLGRQEDHPVKIIDLSIPLAYHAGAPLFSYFPYCTGEQALGYLDAAHIDYIVLRRGEFFTRYYADWLEHGIPDSRAERLQLPSIPGADKFLVFRWHSGTKTPQPSQ